MLVLYGLFVVSIFQILQSFLRLTLPINDNYIVLQIMSQLFQMGSLFTGILTLIAWFFALVEVRKNKHNEEFELGSYYTTVFIIGVCISIITIL